MASTYSPNLRLELMATGENRSTWGNKANTVFSLIEASVTGYESIAMANANVTLSTNNGAADQARKMILKFTGAHTAIRTVTIPTVPKIYIMTNGTTGGFDITISNGSSTVNIVANETAMIWTDGTTVDSNSINGGNPAGIVGSVMDYAGTTTPLGWLLCYGQAISRTTYSALFTAIGTLYGVGDGATTFNIPDCRGRVTAGQDDMGGVSANRLTTPLDGDTLGAAGGAESVALSTAELAAHTHTSAAHAHGFGTLAGTTNSNGAHTHSLSNGTVIGRDLGAGTGSSSFAAGTRDMQGTVTALSAGLHNHTVDINTGSTASATPGATGSAGSGTAHNNVQPTIIFNKIIFSGV
jgi:microcystin-dependent protein